MKKTLIISNNVLSSKNNNGKTLLSFFKELPPDMLAQVYFSNENIEEFYASKYYRLSENEVIKSIYNRRLTIGNEFSYIKRASANNVDDKKHDFNSQLYNTSLDLLRKSDTARIIRELTWKLSRIDYRSLNKWVDEFGPDVIFFCAGDSLFAYEVYKIICSYRPQAKKIIYVTDDYITKRKKLQPMWWIRRNLVLALMKDAVTSSDLFITISEDMRNEYRSLLGKDSITTFNMSANIKIDNFEKKDRTDLLFVYTGGLHFKRWETLVKLAQSIKQFNLENGRNVTLEIYSHQVVEKKIKKSLNVKGASKFCGELNESGVQQVLNNADVLVHVESFAKDCIESTRLSISTKISEYINVGGEIFAIGPSDIASMKLLEGHVCCANTLHEIPEKLNYLLSNTNADQNLEELKSIIEENITNFKENVFR